jgi:hypothetical protein
VTAALVAVILLGWLVLATALAVVVGKAIRHADTQQPAPDGDPLAAWPGVWSPAERDARLGGLW